VNVLLLFVKLQPGPVLVRAKATAAITLNVKSFQPFHVEKEKKTFFPRRWKNTAVEGEPLFQPAIDVIKRLIRCFFIEIVIRPK
jgi:hypothetical protein